MKSKMLLFLMVATMFSTAAKAIQPEPLYCTINAISNVGHKINGYKYLYMENQGNQYDLEDKFNAFFESIGFTILAEDDEEKLDENEKKYVLYGTYQCTFATNEDGTMSNLTLTLRDYRGKIVFSSSKGGWSSMSPRRGFNKASNKIINQLKELNYSFDPTLTENSKIENKTNISVESAKEEKIKLARQMKADSLSYGQIERYTGLTKEEIEKL